MSKKKKDRNKQAAAVPSKGNPLQPKKRVIDRDKAEIVRSLLSQPRPVLPDSQAPDILPEVVPDSRTEEQRAIEEAARLARKLMGQEGVAQLMASLVCVRQLYVVLWQTLQGKLDEVREIAPLIEDFLVQYAMFEASRAFDLPTMMDRVIKVLLPLLASVVDDRLKQDAQQAQADRLEEDKARRETPIPVGFKYHQDEPELLPRDRSLVLVGYGPAVSWLLQRIARLVSEKHTVVHFLAQAPAARESSVRLIRLATNLWNGCCNANGSLALCMGMHVADQLSWQPDLLLCDDMSLARSRDFVGRAKAASAGDAHKQFRSWCNEAGCAFIGAVPVTDRETPDLSGPEYEQLRTFSTLRPVMLLEKAEGLAEDHDRLVIGQSAFLDVPKEELAACGKSTVLTAGVLAR